MVETTSDMARSITRAGSKQAYYTARLLVDRELVYDFYRAYAYFRWADDVVDCLSRSHEEGIAFIRRQGELIDRLYRGERPDHLTPEEEIMADLISHDQSPSSGLQSFIRNMLAVIEFDAHRRGRLISQRELTWYSDCLAISVTDGLQYFIGHDHPYPDTKSRYQAAIGAHIAHQLRDMLRDIAEGFVNIPREFLEMHGINPHDVDSPPFPAWVRDRVRLARQYLHEGKMYLNELDVLRCKIAGHWYCARFEGILDAIERDDYLLRAAYNEQRNLASWLNIARLGITVALRHIIQRGLVGILRSQRDPPTSVKAHEGG